jgi:DNA-binding MarR family transcriptional regulator
MAQINYLYHAGMSTERDALADIDTALMRLRRLWTTPHRRADLERDVGEGVPLSQVLVVDAVARGGHTGEVTVGSVAEQLSIDESTASRLIDATVRAGFAERGRSPADARRAVLTLTPAGRQLYDRAVAYRVDYLAGLLDDWTPWERDVFAELLRRFADAVAG